MIRIVVISAAALIALTLAGADCTLKPAYAHGLIPGDDDVFFRRYRGDDEVSDDDRRGGRDKDKGRGKDKGSESSGGSKGSDGRGGKSGGGKSKEPGRPNPNDSDDRFGQ